MKRIVTVIVLALTIISINAQKKDLTIKEAVSQQYKFLYPEQLVGLKWRTNTSDYSYIKNFKDVIIESTEARKKTKIITLDNVNKVLKSAGKTEMSYFYSYNWIDEQTIRFDDNTRFIHYNYKTKKIKYIEKPEYSDGYEFCNENKMYAYTIKNNLYIINENAEQTAITNYKDTNIVNGQTVSRSEFGITDGIFWSPKGNFLAFYKKDESAVTNYPLIDISTIPAHAKYTKYPMAGNNSEYLKIGIYNIKTGKTIFLDTDAEQKDQYLINPAWSPDEKHIILARLNREQNHAKTELFDAQTGKLIRTLFEEKNNKWVEPETYAYFISNDKFIWQSEKDGYNHMCLYDLNGKLIKQLTKGNWIVTEIKDYDVKNKLLYYTSTQNSPLENNLYSVNTKTGKISQITNVFGTHNLDINLSAGYIIDGYSNTKIPEVYDIIDLKGRVIRNLVTAENPLKDYNISMPELGTIKSADDKTDLYYRLIKPTNFDKNKKYPAIIYVYGGPHVQLITNSWMAGAQMWLYYMAEKGYVVFTIDNRGSANRGFEFESIIHRKVGQNEMKDQIKGVEFLKSLGYVDQNRIGIHGWSFGGFMTISLVENYPDVFKAAVAGGPVTDWKFYEVMYGERYMDMPKENPDGYQLTSTLDKVANIKTKLLVIHGGVDSTVVPQQSYQFLRECIKNGVQVDFFTYPTHEHNVRGKDRDHLMKKITKYFESNL